MIQQTPHEKGELLLAKANYKKLKKNKEVFNHTLNEILTSFSKCKLPDWGTFIFNKQKINAL